MTDTEKYWRHEFKTDELVYIGEFPNFKAAWSTQDDPTQGIVWSESNLRRLATDNRYKGGIKLQNPKNRRAYAIQITADGFALIKPGQWAPPSRPPMQYVGD